MSSFYQDFSKFKFPRFLQGDYLRATLTMLPTYARETIQIMVPYLIKSEILDSILNAKETIKISLYTRDEKGYLPNLKPGAQPALDKLFRMKNLEIFIDNRIHAKIWLFDTNFAIVHSMNGTPHSELSNFEAGVISVQPELIKEVEDYFLFVRSQSKQIKQFS